MSGGGGGRLLHSIGIQMVYALYICHASLRRITNLNYQIYGRFDKTVQAYLIPKTLTVYNNTLECADTTGYIVMAWLTVVSFSQFLSEIHRILKLNPWFVSEPTDYYQIID